MSDHDSDHEQPTTCNVCQRFTEHMSPDGVCSECWAERRNVCQTFAHPTHLTCLECWATRHNEQHD